jgi:PKD repeat protein
MIQFDARLRRAFRAHTIALMLLAQPALIGLGPRPASAAPPANDNFLNAAVIGPAALPYTATEVITEATTEGGEPFPCAYSYQSVWFKFTPSHDGWLAAGGSGTFAGVSAYADSGGGGFFTLAFLACSNSGPGGQAQFLGHAGSTYYLQALAQCCFVSGSLTVTLQEVPAPAPHADFYFYPGDPSVYDLVQYYDQSYDPGGQPIQSRMYEFGDGTRDSTCCPQHRFAADGDYSVKLTITTLDGRSASVTHPISVRTHDVAISDFKVPQSASVGQSRSITVSVTNTRYPEMVHIELQRSTPGPFFGFVTIGTSDQLVQVRGKNRSTDFQFTYTFTPDDGAIGKVTFRASAALQGSRDALAADNEAISPPVRVNKGIIAMAPGTEVFDGTSDDTSEPLRILANPARAGADLSIRLALPEAGRANVQVLDLAGRVVTSRDLGSLAAGVHDARVAWQTRPTPGIYWVRFTLSGHVPHTVRVAVLD